MSWKGRRRVPVPPQRAGKAGDREQARHFFRYLSLLPTNTIYARECTRHDRGRTQGRRGGREPGHPWMRGEDSGLSAVPYNRIGG